MILEGKQVDRITLMNEKGREFNLLDLQPGDLTIHDLASSGAKINRYCGFTKFPFSVITHSVLVSHLCPPSQAWGGLTHDLTEATGLNDVISPVKHLLPGFSSLEDLVRMRLSTIFGFPETETPEVKAADILARVLEKHYLKGLRLPDNIHQGHLVIAHELLYRELPWQVGRDLFLDRYEELIGTRPTH